MILFQQDGRSEDTAWKEGHLCSEIPPGMLRLQISQDVIIASEYHC